MSAPVRKNYLTSHKATATKTATKPKFLKFIKWGMGDLEYWQQEARQFVELLSGIRLEGQEFKGDTADWWPIVPEPGDVTAADWKRILRILHNLTNIARKFSKLPRFVIRPTPEGPQLIFLPRSPGLQIRSYLRPRKGKPLSKTIQKIDSFLYQGYDADEVTAILAKDPAVVKDLQVRAEKRTEELIDFAHIRTMLRSAVKARQRAHQKNK